MAHNFMGDRVETWFPEDNSRNPHDVGGVRFKWGRTTRELIDAKKRAGLGRIDDPYSVERQKELWSDNAVNEVLQNERLGDPKQAQHDAEAVPTRHARSRQTHKHIWHFGLGWPGPGL